MGSVVLAPAIFDPYKSGQFLEIDSSYPLLTFIVATQEARNKLPGLLKALPRLINELNDSQIYTTEQRSHAYQRILQLEDQVGTYNKEIDQSFWVTVLHVILLILTFGGFDYRKSCKLEEILGSQFHNLFDKRQFQQSYTAECFRSLPEELRDQLSSLLGFSKTDVAILLNNARAESDTLAQRLRVGQFDSKEFMKLYLMESFSTFSEGAQTQLISLLGISVDETTSFQGGSLAEQFGILEASNPTFLGPFDAGIFEREFTVEQFRSLEEGLQRQFSILLQLTQEESLTLLEQARMEGATLANRLSRPERMPLQNRTIRPESLPLRANSTGANSSREKPKLSLENFLSIECTVKHAYYCDAELVYQGHSYVIKDLLPLVVDLSFENLIMMFGLKKVVQQEVNMERASASIDKKVEYVVCGLTKEQWKALSRPLFFLFAPYFVDAFAWRARSYSQEQQFGQRSDYMTNVEFETLYLEIDPSLSLIGLLKEWQLFQLVKNPKVAETVRDFSVEAVEVLIKTLISNKIPVSEISAYINLQIVPNLSLFALLEVHHAATSEDLKRVVKEAFSKYTLDDLKHTFDLSLVARRIVPLLTEKQWRELPNGEFLSFLKATFEWVEVSAGWGLNEYISRKLRSVEIGIENQTLRNIYSSHSPSPTLLADLIIGPNGGGSILAGRLQPFSFDEGKVLLTKMGAHPDAEESSYSKMIPLVFHSFPSGQLTILENDIFKLAARFFRISATHPNFKGWLERLLNEKENHAIVALCDILETEKSIWNELMREATSEFIWSIFAVIFSFQNGDYSDARSVAVQKLFQAMPLAKWKEMIESATPKNLISVFETTTLPATTDEDREKIIFARDKLAQLSIPIASQKNILSFIVWTKPNSQVQPLWGEFVEKKIDLTLVSFWKEQFQLVTECSENQ